MENEVDGLDDPLPLRENFRTIVLRVIRIAFDLDASVPFAPWSYIYKFAYIQGWYSWKQMYSYKHADLNARTGKEFSEAFGIPPTFSSATCLSSGSWFGGELNYTRADVP